MNGNKIYSSFDLLRFPLILGVVMIHCNFLQFVGAQFDSEAAGGFVEFHTVFKKYVLDLCVPAFFVISGFMFFRNGAVLTFRDYADKLRRRVSSLLLPYLLWNLAGFILFLLKNRHTLELGSLADVAGLLGGFVCRLPADPFPYDFPLWFIRNLMFIILLSPLISILLRSLKAAAPLLLLGLCVGVAEWAPGVDKLGLLPNLLFFTAGAALSCHGRRLLSPRLLWPMAASYISASAVCIAAVHDIFPMAAWLDRTVYLLASAAGILLTLEFACGLTERGHAKMPRFLAGSTFFLYAFHGLFSVLTCKTVIHLLPPTGNLICFADYLLIFTLLVTISMAAYALLHRFAPALLSLLSGNRITPRPTTAA